ncbi:MAG: hypothetical protein P4L93_10100 [Coriobacteriia bacterium]|nr:hypothetical protein [Coriobacteriia bacterium]
MPGGTPQLHGLEWFTGGPVGWYILGMYVLAVGLALFVLVDSLRAVRREHLAELPEPAWIYPVFGGGFLVFVFSVLLPFVPVAFSAVSALLTPFWLAIAVAYLLRVVFPKPAQLDEASEVAADDEPSDDAS